jgi:hypothetical protein
MGRHPKNTRLKEIRFAIRFTLIGRDIGIGIGIYIRIGRGSIFHL